MDVFFLYAVEHLCVGIFSRIEMRINFWIAFNSLDGVLIRLLPPLFFLILKDLYLLDADATTDST